MALLNTWRDRAYDESMDQGTLQRFWAIYFDKETLILKNKYHCFYFLLFPETAQMKAFLYC